MADFRIRVVVDPRAAVAGSDKVERRLIGLGQTANRVRAQFMSLLGAGGIALVLAGVTRTIAEFEQTMSTVRGITGATDAQFKELTATAQELGATTRFTAAQAGEGLLFLARAGFSVQKSIETVDDTLRLAQAGALDLGTAADIASNILTGFRLNTDQAARVVDVLALAANSANTNVGQLGQAMKFVAPVAAGLNVSVEESTAAIAALSNAGLQASMAGTGLRKVLAELESPSSKSKEILAGLGVSADQVRVSSVGLTQALRVLRDAGVDTGLALEIFGQRGGPAFEVLSTSIPFVEQMTEKLGNAEGTAKRIAEVMDDNLNGALLAVKSAAQAVILQFGQLGGSSFLTGFFRGLAAALRGLADNLDIVIRLMKALVVVLMVAFAQRAVSAVVAGLKLLSAQFYKLTLVIASNPLGAFAVAVTAVVALLVAFGDKIKLTNEGAATLADLFGVAADMLKVTFGAALEFVQAGLQKFGDLIGTTFDDFDFSVAGAIRGLARFADFLANSLMLPFRLAFTVGQKLPAALEDAFKSGLNKVLSVTEDGVNKVVAALNKIPGVDIDLVDIPELENKAAGAGAALGQALLQDFRDTVQPGVATELADRLIGEAERRAQERAAAAAIGGGAAPVPAPGGPGAGGEPTTTTTGGVQQAVKALKIQERLYQGLVQSNSERRVAAEVMRIEEELTRSLTEAERELVETQIDRLQVLQTQAAILDELRGPQEELQLRYEALQALLQTNKITTEEFNEQVKLLAQSTTELDNSVRGGLSAGLLEIANRTQDLGQNVQNFVVGAFDKATDAIVNFATTGKFEFRAFVTDLLQQLAKLALQQAISSALTGAFGGATGGIGGFLGGLGSNLNLVGAQNGLNATIGGSGGTDSQLVAFKGTPGEHVQVSTPGQQANNQPIVVQAPPVNITNVQSADDIPLGIESAEGEQAVLNVLTRNKGAVKALTG